MEWISSTAIPGKKRRYSTRPRRPPLINHIPNPITPIIRTTNLRASAALRSPSFTSRRKTQRTQRHLTAFWLKAHPQIKEIRDFETEGKMAGDAHRPGDRWRVPTVGGAGEFEESVGGYENSVWASAASLAVGTMLEEGALWVEANESKDAVGKNLSTVLGYFCGFRFSPFQDTLDHGF